MPIYPFICDEELDGCGHTFDVIASMKESTDLQPKCENCKKKKPVRRDYKSQGAANTPRTIGMLAEANGRKLTTEQQKAIIEKNRNKPKYSGPMPQGGNLFKRGKDSKRVGSGAQRTKDIGKRGQDVAKSTRINLDE